LLLDAEVKRLDVIEQQRATARSRDQPVAHPAGRYLTGGIDQALAGRFDGVGAGAGNLALIGDRQGTTLVALRGDGTKEVNAIYYSRDAYGGLVGAPGEPSEGTTNTETGYTGASTPNGTGGFAYFRNRWYDPKTGKFLTQDPIGLAGGVNLYSYAGSNPVAYRVTGVEG
jgi:RHS repeat-associated protein